MFFLCSAILVHWYPEKRQQLVKMIFFFVFTISPLVSLLLSRFYRSKKYVRDIYQPDWKIQPSVGPADPSGPAVGPRHSMHVHEAVGPRHHLGSPSGPHPSKYNEHARSASVQLPAPMGHPDPPMVVFSNLVDKYLQHTF